MAEAPKVFISYSHRDEVWKTRLLVHLTILAQRGLLDFWDDHKINAGATWYDEIREVMAEAAVAICLVSADYLSSDFVNKEEIPYLLKRRETEGMALIPVLLHPSYWEVVPWLSATQTIPRDGKTVCVDYAGREDIVFAQVAREVHAILQKPGYRPAGPQAPWTPPDSIDINRLPETGAQLFGRKGELLRLDEVWNSASANVISFIAWGGVGKSTLVNHWLELMRSQNYRGAKRVFGWSFYSQGTGERVTSADQFINEALKWFGDPDPAKGPPWDRGQRLAELVRQQKTLLILDGLEPLQSGYQFEKGKIKDPALSVLVSELARKNDGLCVITTRERVAELERYPDTAMHVDLEQVSKEAGRALLRIGGVQGADEELEAASEAFGNHALAISLLAAYLRGTAGHHILHAGDIADVNIPESEGRHPRRVMEAFEKRFGDDSPHTQLLRTMGLFDRPADVNAIDALRIPPPIAGVTDALQTLNERQWVRLLDELRDFKLLARRSRCSPNVIDCHPLIREYFGEKLKAGNPSAWREAHRRLYDYYRNLPQKLCGKYMPDTLEEMEPLFLAVAHACRCGLHSTVLETVYKDRLVRRGSKHTYLRDRLGAVSSELAAVSHFLVDSRSKAFDDLEEDQKAFVLGTTGLLLSLLCRFREATAPLQGALEIYQALFRRGNAARVARHLSRNWLSQGQLHLACQTAEEGVRLAGEKGKPFAIMTAQATLGYIYHQMGRMGDAERVFEVAERAGGRRTGARIGGSHRILPWLHGFRYCEFLLSRGRYPDVIRRAAANLRHKDEKDYILGCALHRLTLAHAYMLRARGREKRCFQRSQSHMQRALKEIRGAQQPYQLPGALLVCAELNRHQRDWKKARSVLAEVREIAERSGMGLYLADYHLEAGRLCLAEGGRLGEAREHLEEATTRVEEMGYHRRDPELLLIRAEVEFEERHPGDPCRTLKEARKRIDAMGCHCWDFEVARLGKKLDC